MYFIDLSDQKHTTPCPHGVQIPAQGGKKQ